MAASDALGRQWYHGSPEELEPGTELHPTSKTGKAPTRGDSLPDRVYVTPHQFVAAQYTWKFGHDGKLAPGQDPREGGSGPHGHIYEVEPVGRTLADKNAPMPGLSYHTKSARVVRRVPKEEWS